MRIKHMKLVLLIAVTLTLVGFSADVAKGAEAEFVRGQVKQELSDGTLVPVPRHEVRLVQTRRDFEATTYTRSDGVYHFRNVDYGTYELQVEHRGKMLKYEVKVDEKVEDLPSVVLR